MVCAAAWTDNVDTTVGNQPNLVTAAFDSTIIGWHIRRTQVTAGPAATHQKITGEVAHESIF